MDYPTDVESRATRHGRHARRLREGFVGQDLYVIPRPILAEVRRHPLIRALYPTDIGWFPQASHHYRDRRNGAPEDHLMLCIGGSGYAVIGGRRCHLRANEILIIPRNAPHTYWAAKDAPWSIYWMHFLGENADYYVERMPRPGKPAPVDAAARDEAVRLFRDCLNTLQDGYSLPTLIYAAQSAQHILSLLLFRNPALPVEQRDASRKATLDASLEFMHAHVGEPLRLEDFARHAGLSVSHYSELFRSQTGQSPMAYFTQLRIRSACRLLDLTGRPVKSVAVETGYSDPYYFSRVFKKVMGISPERYRDIKKG